MGGILLRAPLESRRPTEETGPIATHAPLETVRARLWQDPLSAIHRHYNLFRSDPSSGRFPPLTIRNFVKRKETWSNTLLVMMTGGPYAEDREDRRRQRHAVVSALAKKDYAPEVADRIGYVVGDPFVMSPDGTNSAPSRMLVGFEFYYKPSAKRILVLWLNSDDFGACALHRVSALMLSTRGSNHGNRDTVLFGPVTSGALPRMVHDTSKSSECLTDAKKWLASTTPTDKDNEQIEMGIGTMRILSPRATAPLHELFPEVDCRSSTDNSDGNRVDRCFGEKIGVESFSSVVARDDVILRSILKELDDRVVDRTGIPLIAIVSEQDSTYGRLLHRIAEGIATKDCRARGRNKDCYEVKRYGYLLGVDGEMPPAHADPTTAANGVKENTSNQAASASLMATSDQTVSTSLMATSHREQSFGVSQLDYVRRLADQIAYDSAGPANRPVVIGVLGSDVYDKLLVLQALRERLPTATFFSTDLDARMNDPDVYAWTRNLIIGSSYGFTVKGQEVGGFRDSYQTALYRAVELALDQQYQEPAACPRLFEIGRTGPVDITESTTACMDRAYEDVHGSIPYIRSENSTLRWLCSVLFVLTPLLLLTIYAFIKKSVLHRKRRSSLYNAHRRVVCVGVVSFTALIGVAWCLKYGGYEPWPFLEGVNSVPTLLLRLTVVVFAYALVDIAVGKIRQAHHDIQEEFGLRARWCSSRHGRGNGWWLSRWMRELSGVNQETKEIEDCWRKYMEYSDWRARLARVAVPILAVLGVLAFVGLFSWNLFPRPDPLLTRHLGEFIGFVRGLAVFATLATVVFCRDTLKLGQAILRELVRYSVRWNNVSQDCISQHSRTMDLIARYTECVAPIAILPFILMFLLILARSSVFEGWIWTRGALSLYAGMGLFVLIQALRFQFQAARAKDAILASLDDYRLEIADDPGKASRLDAAREKIMGIRRGAFVPWTRHPILQSLFLPFGAYGVLILLDTLF